MAANVLINGVFNLNHFVFKFLPKVTEGRNTYIGEHGHDGLVGDLNDGFDILQFVEGTVLTCCLSRSRFWAARISPR